MDSVTDAYTDQVVAAQAGDETAFAAVVQRHRRELQVHCYRMLGSYEESEDMVQETFLRAWRRRETFAARSTFRAWLYRIATNACLDHLDANPRRPVPVPAAPGHSEVPWLQPFPDRLLDQVAPEADEPDAVIVARETIELAFLVAVQHLPPRQRAVLMLRDVMGWRASETAELLGSSVASVNSALQRARTTLREHLPERRAEWNATGPTEEERTVLQRFVEACEEADVTALGALLREDAIFSMPPEPGWYQGRDVIMAAWAPAMAGPESFGEFRLVPVAANRQLAAANYVRRPGTQEFAALTIDVLRIEGGAVAEVTTFGADKFRCSVSRPPSESGSVVDGEPITFLGRPPGPSFRTRYVTIAAGDQLAYVESEWQDALVVVERGEVELECRGGTTRTFGGGDVLWLHGLGVIALHNRGDVTAVLVAVSRRRRDGGDAGGC